TSYGRLFSCPEARRKVSRYCDWSPIEIVTPEGMPLVALPFEDTSAVALVEPNATAATTTIVIATIARRAMNRIDLLLDRASEGPTGLLLSISDPDSQVFADAVQPLFRIVERALPGRPGRRDLESGDDQSLDATALFRTVRPTPP